MLDVVDLAFDYPEKPVFSGVSFSLPQSALLHLRGKNGAGKTTLLKVIAGLLLPAHGAISYQQQSIHDDLPAYHQQLCYVGHKLGVSTLLTVRQNLMLDPCNRQPEAALGDAIAGFGLQGLEEVVCGLLSAGQRRRVALSRVLLSNASLWLLDEPFVALDEQGLSFLMQCIQRHLDTGGSVVLTSHQPLPVHKIYSQEYVL